MSGLVNKVKDALHGDSHKHDNNVPEGTHGPHGSRVANAADPRVDSDLDSTGRGTGAGRVAGHGEYGSGVGTTTGAREPGLTGSGVTGSGVTGSGVTGSGVTGSGVTGSGVTGSGVTGSGYDTGYSGNTTGTGAYESGPNTLGQRNVAEGTHGPHSSRVANAADPRVDSDRDHRAALGTGPGPAPNTAGPHKSDALNKADPRVDSDLDGSRTVGGNKTYQSGSGVARDPTDAAQVPPSVLRQHVGEVSMEHGDVTHGRERRNSTKTHQESFRGI